MHTNSDLRTKAFNSYCLTDRASRTLCSMIFLQLHLILLLLITSTDTWDVDYVTQKLVIPTARMTQGIVYCVCRDCYDERLDRLLRLTQNTIQHPQLVLTNRTDIELRNGNHKRNLLTIVVAKSLKDIVFEVFDRVLRGRHFYLCLVIMVDTLNDFSLAETWLQHLQLKWFVNTNLYYRNHSTGQNEVFGFDSYPKFRVQNKSLLIGNLRAFFTHAQSPFNVRGYEFQTPLMQQAPNVIRVGEGNNSQVKGSSYNVLKIFTQYINGSLVEYRQHEPDTQQQLVDMHHVLDLVRSERVEVAAHAYALFDIDAQIDKSYPISVVKWCLMVPLQHSISTSYYMLLPFEIRTWGCLLFTLSVWLIFHFWWQRHLPINFLLQSICHFLNLSPTSKVRHKDCVPHVLLNCCVFFHGFFLCAFYTSMLGSFLTVTIPISSINTIADLIATQLPVMIIDYEFQFLTRSWNASPAFRNLLHVVNSSYFYRHQFELNTSFAYFVTEDQWNFLDLQQRFLRNGCLFKFTNICFGSYHQAFPMQPESPIWRELEYFLYRIHSSGLFFFYESKADSYARQAGLLHRLTDGAGFESIGMAHLKVAFLLHSLLLGVGCVCFLLEVFLDRCWSKLSRRRILNKWLCRLLPKNA